MSQSENFVGHTGVQEVFDAVWYGRPKNKVKSFFLLTIVSNDYLIFIRLRVNNLIECLQVILHHLVMQQLEYCKIKFCFYFLNKNFKFYRSKDQQNYVKLIFTAKNKLSRPRVKYHVHFLFYMIFLLLLSFHVLFVKPSLIEINQEIDLLNQNITTIKLESSKQTWSILQMIINIWVFMFAVEEFRQVKLTSK